MCTVSMVGDHYQDIWKHQQWFNPMPMPQDGSVTTPFVPVTRAEFDELKRQVTEMVALLKRAAEYDKRNNEPACETDEKMDLLRKVAKLVGVDLDAAVGLKGGTP